MKTIDVIISETGSVTIKPQGFEGNSCLEATNSLENALGIVSSREMNKSNNLTTNNTIKANAKITC